MGVNISWRGDTTAYHHVHTWRSAVLKRALSIISGATLGLLGLFPGVGCGVPHPTHNAVLRELERTKVAHYSSQRDCIRESNRLENRLNRCLDSDDDAERRLGEAEGELDVLRSLHQRFEEGVVQVFGPGEPARSAARRGIVHTAADYLHRSLPGVGLESLAIESTPRGGSNLRLAMPAGEIFRAGEPDLDAAGLRLVHALEESLAGMEDWRLELRYLIGDDDYLPPTPTSGNDGAEEAEMDDEGAAEEDAVPHQAPSAAPWLLATLRVEKLEEVLHERGVWSLPVQATVKRSGITRGHARAVPNTKAPVGQGESGEELVEEETGARQGSMVELILHPGPYARTPLLGGTGDHNAPQAFSEQDPESGALHDQIQGD